MKIDAVCVGTPQTIVYKNREVETSIFKKEVDTEVRLYSDHLEGDRQSDLKVHGGPTRAIYGYASEYYAFWQNHFNGKKLPWGFFGENLSISGGLFESEVHVGDRFQIGDVEIEAIHPRLPCYKLAIKVGDPGFVATFQNIRKTGVYFSVIKEGSIRKGQTLVKSLECKDNITIDDITNLYLFDKNNKSLLEKALATDPLPQQWKDRFQLQLKNL